MAFHNEIQLHNQRVETHLNQSKSMLLVAIRTISNIPVSLKQAPSVYFAFDYQRNKQTKVGSLLIPSAKQSHSWDSYVCSEAVREFGEERTSRGRFSEEHTPWTHGVHVFLFHFYGPIVTSPPLLGSFKEAFWKLLKNPNSSPRS